MEDLLKQDRFAKPSDDVLDRANDWWDDEYALI